MLLAIEDIGEDSTVFDVGLHSGLVAIFLWSLRLETPSCIQTHQRGSLVLHFVDFIASDLVENHGFDSFALAFLQNVLLRRLNVIQGLMFTLLGRLRHEVVLAKHFFCRLQLPRGDLAICVLVLLLELTQSPQARVPSLTRSLSKLISEGLPSSDFWKGRRAILLLGLSRHFSLSHGFILHDLKSELLRVFAPLQKRFRLRVWHLAITNF